jgi:hypothetical protein
MKIYPICNSNKQEEKDWRDTILRNNNYLPT